VAARPETPPVPEKPVVSDFKGVHKFEIRPKNNVWVRVWVDDRLRYEGISRLGAPKTWDGKWGFHVSSADPALLEIFVDGEKQGVDSGEFKWTASQSKPMTPPAAETEKMP
jgi:hypothetical protein